MVGETNLPRIIVIVGPTASGKTDLGIKLAKKFNGEIVSADSRQIYRGMDTGTAKPPKHERGGTPHYLIDIRNPNEDYSVAGFKKDATAAIKKILHRKKLPILVGGTGLYVKTVVDNLNIPAVKADPLLRKKLEKEIDHNGLGRLFQKLIELDPEAAYIVDPKNPRRVIRALEVALKTKKPFSATQKTGPPPFSTLKIGLRPTKEILKKKIEARAEQMFKNGLVKEVEKLVKKYGSDHKAFDAIGYREIVDYLDGKITLGEAEELVKKNTWHYAKRQMTWFKKDKEIHWVKPGREPLTLLRKFLS